MSNIAEIIEKLQSAEAAVAKIEEAVRENPDMPSLLASWDAMRQHQLSLRAEFAAATENQWVDVCSYRMFRDDGSRPTLNGLASSLKDFQEAFSLIYDALKNGPKTKARISEDAAKATDFGYAYSFPGSVGFVLTLPNDRVLVDESEIDHTFDTVFRLAKSRSAEQIRAFVHDLGPAPIRKIYRWADDNVRSGIGADIDWMRKDEVRQSLFIQTPEFEELCRAIDEISDEQVDELMLTGQLVGADVASRTFHMVFERSQDIRGKMHEDIGTSYLVELSKRYTARIIRRKVTRYATEDEDVSYFLVELSEPSSVSSYVNNTRQTMLELSAGD